MNKVVRDYFLILCLCVSLVMIPSTSRSQSESNLDFPSYESGDDSEDYYDSTNSYDYSADDDSDYSTNEDYYADDDSDENNEQIAPEPSLPQIKPGEPIKIEEKSIRIGRIPYMSIKEMMGQTVPLLRLLQKRTGAKEVRMVSSGKNYSSILEALARKKIDFAWVGPTAYLKCRDKDGLMAIAKSKYGNDTAYRGVFIAPAKGKVQGLEDLKGSTIGFVDRHSASGFIYPMYLLKSLGIKIGKETSVKFLRNHDNVLGAVLKGQVDAGCCLEATLNACKDKDLYKKIIVLGKTTEIPSDVIVCRQDCPINLRERFQQALIQVKVGELPAKSPTFLPAFDDEFTSVEEIMKFIGALKK